MIRAAMFDTKPYDKEAFDALSSPSIAITYFETKLTSDTVRLAKGFDCVIAFVNDTLDKAVLDALLSYGITLVALRCAGFNNVDIHAAFGKVHILRVPAYSPHAVAEHAAALLLTSVRRIHKAYNRTREYNFSLNDFTGMDLYEKTVGIVGMGRIGSVFADICRGFGMRVLAYDTVPRDMQDVTFVSLDTLFSESDIISLHCPLVEENYHMVDKKAIDTMKNGVILINTSRGALVDSDALLEGIKSRKIGAACLDVYEEESDLFFADKSNHILHDDTLARLLTMPNVIVTSHQACLTQEALEGIAKTTLKNIADFFDGKALENEICYHCQHMQACMKERKGRCF